MIHLLCLSVIVFSFQSAHCGPYSVFPPVANVTTGEGLVLQVIPADTPLTSCIVRLSGRNSTDLKPNEDNDQSIGYWGRGLEEGDCGAIVHSFDPESHSGNWIFQLLTANGSSRTAIAKITAIDLTETNSTITIIGELGEEVEIPCGKTDAIYCQLINPTGDIVRNGQNCSSAIQRLRKADVGLWRCSEGISQSAVERVTEINISVNSINYMKIGQNETLKLVNIFCNHSSKNLTYCRFERPDGKAFILSDGHNIDRYTYFGRGISVNHCGLSILKPLESEDLGTWMCTLGLNDGTRSGGFVRVGPSGPGIDTVLQNTSVQSHDVVVQVGFALILACFVKTPISYCWFKHPNGTRYNPHPDFESEDWRYHGDSLSQGQCGMQILKAQISDTGTWNCGMGVENGYGTSKDLQSTFSVTVSELPFIQNRSVTSAMMGDWVILSCHSLQGEALQYCSFLAPNGTGYSLRQGQARGRLTYHGDGLENGDCGVLINPVQSEDYGTWQCGSMLAAAKDGKELVRSLILQSPGFLRSSAIGLAVGVVVAVAVIFGTVLYCRYRRRNQGLDTTETRPHALSTASDGSDEVELRVISTAGVE